MLSWKAGCRLSGSRMLRNTGGEGSLLQYRWGGMYRSGGNHLEVFERSRSKRSPLEKPRSKLATPVELTV